MPKQRTLLQKTSNCQPTSHPGRPQQETQVPHNPTTEQRCKGHLLPKHALTPPHPCRLTARELNSVDLIPAVAHIAGHTHTHTRTPSAVYIHRIQVTPTTRQLSGQWQQPVAYTWAAMACSNGPDSPGTCSPHQPYLYCVHNEGLDQQQLQSLASQAECTPSTSSRGFSTRRTNTILFRHAVHPILRPCFATQATGEP